MWRCPICENPFVNVVGAGIRQTKVWRCKHGHAYDLAKQGYLNLLPVQHKSSKLPGDDKQMVLSRLRFLNEGFYEFLVRKIAEITSTLNPNPQVIYDAGCGVGYYLAQLKSIFPDAVCAGHDISKIAIQTAAKTNKDLQLVVASTKNIPIQDASIDVIIQIFAPSSYSQYSRMLKSSGMVIEVKPSKNHLIELKSMVYQSPQTHKLEKEDYDGFENLIDERVTKTVELQTKSQRSDLLSMTPYNWTSTQAQRELIEQSLSSVTFDFQITGYKKIA